MRIKYISYLNARKNCFSVLQANAVVEPECI